MAQNEILRRAEEFGRRLGITGVSPTTLVIIAGICVVVCVLAFLRWSAAPADTGFSIDDDSAIRVAAEGTDGAAQEASEHVRSVESSLVVHVAGAVHRPGLVRCAVGSRVGDAVSAAGGMLGNAAIDSVNLARPLSDGEQIRVPTLDEIAAGTHQPESGGFAAGTSGADSGGDVRINLNAADATTLESLPGIGPATAAKIIADRDANGPFSAPDDLMRVSGIGAKKFEALSGLITVQ
ncbi:MAG: helix-hairpin-helix domain-containing protein [Coriobacteriia bacterium]|nr:helix-hairpin-helix domain-containing protein [Coriobacteriia bacterium]